MAEKKLSCTWSVAGGGETTVTYNDVKQDLDSTTVKAAMQSMVDAGCFATSLGAKYTAPLAAKYVETIETPLFDDSEAAAAV